MVWIVILMKGLCEIEGIYSRKMMKDIKKI
jgi:hypothetical protein